ncbi:MAG: ATP-binding protein [Bacteroidales bacterium]
MGNSIILGLLQNTAILLSFAMLYENLWVKKEKSKTLIAKIFAGFILGGIGVILMFSPWTYVPGINFDTRSVMLSISGLFFGTVPTFIAILICSLVRIYIGGNGIWMGLAVIISSAGIGLLWRYYRPFWSFKKYYYELLLMGLVVHAVMAACTLLLPAENIYNTFKIIALPLLFIYSPSTMLLGLLMLKQYKNWQNKQAQLKLNESERRLTQMLENGNIVSLILNKEGNITFCNNYLLILTGYSLDEIIGRNWFELFIPKESTAKVLHVFAQSIKNENVIKYYENIILTKSGEQLFISWYNISLHSETGEITGTTSIGVNVTKSKMYQQELEEKNTEIEQQNLEYKRLNEELIIAKELAEESGRLKTAFLNNISHEIRTPFNSILGLLSVIQEDELTIEEKGRFVNIINKSAYQLMNTINDIVEISLIQTGQIKPIASKTNIISLSEEVFNFHKSNAINKSLKFILNNKLSKNIKSIAIDGNKLKTILSILLDNAIKFTDLGGNVELNISNNNDFLEFSVKDNGIGIPDNKRPAIFEKFMQADVSDSRKFEGLGLGLSIAKAYVEMLGGKIWLESKHEILTEVFKEETNEKNVGSTFFFTIPNRTVSDKENDIQEINTDAYISNLNESLKVLIAEDDESSAIYIALALKIADKEILKARNGIDAVEICRLNPDLDLVIMDIKMPLMDGYEASRQIRKFNNKVIIIAQTAYVLYGEKETALESGCNDYISKPYTSASLKRVINKHIKTGLE